LNYFSGLTESFLPVQWGKNDTDWAVNAQKAIDAGADALLAYDSFTFHPFPSTFLTLSSSHSFNEPDIYSQGCL
jgi:hypothetical protein